jgi:hypothetical protein
MYNSYTVSGLSRLWRTINSFYKHSIIKKINDTIIKAFKGILSGSYIAKFITNDKSLIEGSVFYTLYQKLICLIESLSNKLRSLIEQYKQGSLLSKTSSSLFESHIAAIGTISIFIIAFSVGNILIDAINGNIRTYGNVLLLIIIVICALIFRNRENAKDTVENSLFIKLLKSIFTIDDGGDQWW